MLSPAWQPPKQSWLTCALPADSHVALFWLVLGTSRARLLANQNNATWEWWTVAWCQQNRTVTWHCFDHFDWFLGNHCVSSSHEVYRTAVATGYHTLMTVKHSKMCDNKSYHTVLIMFGCNGISDHASWNEGRQTLMSHGILCMDTVYDVSVPYTIGYRRK